jgi:hypothetical protein
MDNGLRPESRTLNPWSSHPRMFCVARLRPDYYTVSYISGGLHTPAAVTLEEIR